MTCFVSQSSISVCNQAVVKQLNWLQARKLKTNSSVSFSDFLFNIILQSFDIFFYDCKRNVYFALNETPYWGLIFVIFCQKTLNLVWKLEIMSIGVGSIFSWFKLHLSSSDHNLDRKNKNWFFTFLNFQFRNYFVSQNVVTQIT